jgi:hypothetical protein
MDNWQDLSLDCRRAAMHLADAQHWRSSISRSYYAAYCAVAGALAVHARNLQYRHGWHNPDHNDIPRYIRNNLTHLEETRRWELSKNMRFLRKAREDADYRPGATVDEALTRSALRVAYAVLRTLGVDEP